MDTGSGNTMSEAKMIPRRLFTDEQHLILNYCAGTYAINLEIKYSSTTTMVVKCSDSYRQLKICGSN